MSPKSVSPVQRCVKYDSAARSVEILRIPTTRVWGISTIALAVHAGGLVAPNVSVHMWIVAGMLLNICVGRLRWGPGAIAVLNTAVIPITLTFSVRPGHAVEAIELEYFRHLLWVLPILAAQLGLAKWYSLRPTTLTLPTPRLPTWTVKSDVTDTLDEKDALR